MNRWNWSRFPASKPLQQKGANMPKIKVILGVFWPGSCSVQELPKTPRSRNHPAEQIKVPEAQTRVLVHQAMILGSWTL